MKAYMIVFGMAVLFFSCNQKEITRLQSKVDSLNNVLAENKKTETALNEVGVMLDSIDASRAVLRTKMVEGFSYADYVNRLQEINTSIKDSKEKLAALEKDLKQSKSISKATIARLKNDLELKTMEMVELQMDVAELRDQTNKLTNTVAERDLLVSSQQEVIRMKEADVVSLLQQAKETSEKNRIVVADLYFAEAKALEEAANRTQLAPRKKKETRREALELYKLSFSMGNKEAENKIKELEKALS